MRRTMVALVAGLSVVLTACTGSSATNTPSASPVLLGGPSTAPTAAPSVAASTAPVGSANGAPTAVATVLDPCTIIANSTVNTLAATTYPAGTESVTPGQGKICTYGSQTTNVFMVIVGQAPDPGTAKAWEATAEAALAEAAGKGIPFTTDATIGDGAVYFNGSITIKGVPFNGSAIYVLKGLVFFGFSQVTVGHPSMPISAMTTEAKAIVAALP
jgi:hypothetical protein